MNAQTAMKAQSRGLIEGHSRWTLGKALVVAQIALSLLLVVGAGLFVGTFRNLSRVDPGFTTEDILVVDVDLRRAGIAADAIGATHRSILDRVRAIPGVESASSAEMAPMGGSTWNDEVIVEGFKPKSMMDAVTWFNEVAEGFFATMETRLLAGRDFDRSDIPGALQVAIVNDAWGRQFFGKESPVGHTFRLRAGGRLSDPYTIIGVVENATYRTLRHGREATAYLPSSQNAAPAPVRSIVLRTEGTPALLIPAVKEAMRDVRSGITLDFRILSQMVADGLQRERMLAILAALFGSLALALAILGLYGVMSYAVARRRGELGVRIALGAVRARVIRMVLREVAVVVVIGMMLGAAAALATTKLVTTFLYGVRPNEPGVFVAAITVLGLVAIGAGFIPAWRAARVDPIEALRQE